MQNINDFPLYGLHEIIETAHVPSNQTRDQFFHVMAAVTQTPSVLNNFEFRKRVIRYALDGAPSLDHLKTHVIALMQLIQSQQNEENYKDVVKATLMRCIEKVTSKGNPSNRSVWYISIARELIQLLGPESNISLLDETDKASSILKVSSLLELAVRHNIVDIVDGLIGAGVNVNETDDLGHSPLLYACIYNHWACASLLIDNGAVLPADQGACIFKKLIEADDKE